MSLNFNWDIMYVCVCNAVNERAIREALQEGASFQDLKERLGIGLGCGKCSDFVSGLVKDKRKLSAGA